MKGWKTIADWKAAEIKAGRDGNPKKIRVADGELWESISEIDAMAVKSTPTGKLAPVEIEQVKTGSADKPSAAAAQNAKVVQALQQIAAGDPDVRIYGRTGKNTLGANQTGTFDLTDLSRARTATRGEPGKGFDESTEFPREILEEVARSLIKPGLPPARPPTAPPISLPPDRRYEEDKNR